jgi:putative flippase GtrA
VSWSILFLLTVALFSGVAAGRPFPQDDHFLYQAFIESLAQGRLDLSIPGFHGSDFFAVPWYWVTHSPLAQIQFLLTCILFLPLLAYFAGRSVYRSDSVGLLLAAIITMMPFTSFVAFRGWTGPAYFSLMLLAIALARRFPLLSGLSLAFAILTKPFAVALLPLLLVLFPQRRGKGRVCGVVVALGIPALYVTAQFLAVGRIFVGAHPFLTSANLWVGVGSIFLNITHAFQILFSIHNYYFPNPALTGAGNLLHTTPVLIFLGLFALLSPKDYFEERWMGAALFVGAATAIGLNTLLDHMDHFYMEAGVLLLILASLPVLRKHPLWIPIVLLTLHFQWFYFFLQFQGPFHLEPFFLATPLIVDLLFILWCLIHVRDLSRTFHRWFDGNPLRPWVIGKTHSTRIQFFRYFFVGGSSAVVDFITYVIFLQLGTHYLLAQLFAYCVGFIWNYTFAILWVFQMTGRVVREVVVVFIITLLGLLWTELLLYMFVDFVGIGEIVGKIIATAIVLFWNFGARKVWVYRK